MEKYFNVFLENASICNKLVIKNNRPKKFKSWSVYDSFNGNSEITDFNKAIYGIYKKGSKIQLNVYDFKNEKTIIKNVVIE